MTQKHICLCDTVLTLVLMLLHPHFFLSDWRHMDLQSSQCVFFMCVCSVMSDSFATPWTVAHQTHLSMEFFRQEYWSELPFPPPGDLPDPGVWTCLFCVSCMGRWFFTTVPPGKPRVLHTVSKLGLFLIRIAESTLS